MNIQTLLEQPETFLLIQKTIENHSTVNSLGIPVGDVMEQVIDDLQSPRLKDLDIKSPSGFIYAQVNYSMRSTRRDFLRDRYNTTTTPLDLISPTIIDDTEAPDEDLSEGMLRALDTLTPKEKIVVRRHAIDGLPLKEVAEELGHHKLRSTTLYRQGIRKLRAYLESNPLTSERT